MLVKNCKRCGCITQYPNTYCDKCKAIVEAGRAEEIREQNKRTYRKRDKQYEKFYHSKEWKRLSNDYIMKQITCEVCGELATQVHHREPIQTPSGWAKRLEWSNLQALCLKCHNKAHNRF